MDNNRRFREMAAPSASAELPSFREAIRQAPVGFVCWYAGMPMHLAAMVLVVVSPVAWLLLSDHRRLLWQTDTIRAMPEDPEPVPERAPAPIVLELTTQDDRGRLANMEYLDLPAGISPAQLVEFAAGVIAGEILAQGRWVGGGNPFSRAQFDALMARLQRAGLVAWRDPGSPGQGRILTTRGQRVLARMAADVTANARARTRGAR